MVDSFRFVISYLLSFLSFVFYLSIHTPSSFVASPVHFDLSLRLSRLFVHLLFNNCVCVCNSSATPIRVETMQNFYFAHEPSEINSKRIKTFSRTGLDSTSLPSCYKLNHHHPLVILVVTFLLVLRNPCTVHCSSMHIVASSW